MTNNFPFLDYGKVRLLNVPQAAMLAEESIVRDCYQIGDLKGKWAVADVGACYGEFALFAASLGHSAYAYEPSPYSLRILRLNNELNSQPVEISGKVVAGDNSRQWGELGEMVTHYYRPDHPAGSGPGSGGAIPCSCETVSLAHVVSRLKLCQMPIFVKLDCEGAEVEIFKHIDTWIDGVQAVSMETHNHDADVLGKLLEDRGFNVKLSGTSPYPLPPWNKSMAGGLVIARKSV